MRIIDKKHDFYDYLQDPTDTLVFDRRNSVIITKDMICGAMSNIRYFDIKSDYRFILLQCGSAYWLFLATITDREYYRSHSIYNYPTNYDLELLAFWKNYDKPRKLIDVSVISLGGIYRYNRRGGYQGKSDHDEIISNVERYKYQIDHNNHEGINMRKYLYDEGIPILNAIGIGNHVDPLDVFCAIEEYFSMEKTASETTEAKGATNDDKIIMHGFDTKISFRGKQ